MPSKRTNRRKTIVVNPKQQKELVLTMSLIPALGLTAIMALISYYCHRLYTESALLDVQLDSLVPLFLAVSGFVLVSAFFMVSNALVVSHRIAGPSYRICKSIQQICDGDVAFRVRLRDGDFLTEICDELNVLLDALNANPPAGFQTREMLEQAAGAEDQPAPVAVDDVAAPVAAEAPAADPAEAASKAD